MGLEASAEDPLKAVTWHPLCKREPGLSGFGFLFRFVLWWVFFFRALSLLFCKTYLILNSSLEREKYECFSYRWGNRRGSGQSDFFRSP